jgi:hypothetical protein
MAKSNKEWATLEHGPLIQLQENLWHVEGTLPHMSIGRRMCIAKLTDGRLVLHSPVALEEEAMAALDALGPVGYILVPSGFHRMDGPRFKERYPEATLLCPRGALARVKKVVSVDGTYDDFPSDDSVRLRHLEGMKAAEGVLVVSAGAETTLVFNDAFFNLAHGKGMGGFMMRVMGSSGGPKVTRIMRLLAIKDKKAVAADLASLAETRNLVRLIPGHGDPVLEQAPQVLRQVAANLYS